jgi:hypothetical protein
MRRWYLVEEFSHRLPPHRLWQAPLVDHDRWCHLGHEALIARMRLGGLLWLQNYDLCFNNQLILWTPSLQMGFLFQRPQRLSDDPVAAGPFELSSLHAAQTISASPVRFKETAELVAYEALQRRSSEAQ